MCYKRFTVVIRHLLPGPWTLKYIISFIYMGLVLTLVAIADRVGYLPLWNTAFGLAVGTIFGYALTLRWGQYVPWAEMPTRKGAIELLGYALAGLVIIHLGQSISIGTEAYIAGAVGVVTWYAIDYFAEEAG